MPVFLLAFGLGMVAGTWVAGALADWSVFRSLLGSSLAMALAAAAVRRAGAVRLVGAVPAFLVTVLGSVLVVNLQLRLMDVAGDAQTLGAAMNHASLNIANALGAWLGGLVIAAGLRLPRPGAGRGGPRGGRSRRPRAVGARRAAHVRRGGLTARRSAPQEPGSAQTPPRCFWFGIRSKSEVST